MVGCKGAALSILKEEDPTGKVRFSTIQCGMSRTLKMNCHSLIPLFQTASHIIGQYVHIVGLASNWLMVQKPDRKIEDWKHFYDQVFTAVEGGKNCYTDDVQLFLSSIQDKLPPKVDFEMRQEQTSEMSESAKLHLKSFWSRLVAYLKYRVLDLQIQRLGVIVCQTISGEELCRCLQSDQQVTIEMRKKLSKLPTTEQSVLISILSDVVREEYVALNGLSIHDDKEKVLYKRLVHLQRYSNWNLDCLSRYRDHPTLWTSYSTPEPFSLLPFFKLQPRLVHYTWSVFYKGFLKWAQRESGVEKMVDPISEAFKPFELKKKPDINSKRWRKIMDEKEKKIKTTKKRKRDDDMSIERFVCDVWSTYGLKHRIRGCAQRWVRFVQERKFQRAKNHTVLNIMSQLFDLKHVKQRHRSEWKVVSFRTDGVCLCITFATTSVPPAPNVDALVKEGYNFPELKDKIDIHETKRGIFRLTEHRNDLQTLKSTQERIDIVPLDPGCVKPLQGAVLPSTECTSLDNICTYLSEHETEALWHITSDDWKKKSGRTSSEKHETYLRHQNPSYNEAIRDLRTKRKKCASADVLSEFCTTMFQHLNIMVEQLVTVHKSRVRWKQTRETVSWLSKVADKVFGKEKGHTKQETVRRVAFLGDGTFKHKRGYAPVPKKKLAKVLATKGLTIMLDEFYTSKQCPCGDSELEDHPDIPSTEDLRIRRHKTSGPNGKCCVECTLGESKMDRDVLAITNFLLCVKCALGGESRPNHLCRPWKVHPR